MEVTAVKRTVEMKKEVDEGDDSELHAHTHNTHTHCTTHTLLTS
jgi:hypothetical protein